MPLDQLLPPLLDGAWLTIQITIFSGLAGAMLAFTAGIGRLSNWRAIRWSAGIYIEIFRGTSLLIQLFWLFYALPLLGIQLPPLFAGVAGLALNIGAYGAEVVRGSLEAVPRVQLEAAHALNFTPVRILWHVRLPMAITEMMPPLGNLAIQNLKDSALVSLITLSDLTFRAQNLRNYSLKTVPIFSMTLLLYFAMALVIMLLMRGLEQRLNKRFRRGT